jgi:hypothetical protein
MSAIIHDFERPSWGVSLARALSLIASIAAGVAVFWVCGLFLPPRVALPVG